MDVLAPCRPNTLGCSRLKSDATRQRYAQPTKDHMRRALPATEEATVGRCDSLPKEDLAAVIEHLRVCDTCRAEFDAIRTLRSFYREVDEATERLTPEFLEAGERRLMAAIAAKRASDRGSDVHSRQVPDRGSDVHSRQVSDRGSDVHSRQVPDRGSDVHSRQVSDRGSDVHSRHLRLSCPPTCGSSQPATTSTSSASKSPVTASPPLSNRSRSRNDQAHATQCGKRPPVFAQTRQRCTPDGDRPQCGRRPLDGDRFSSFIIPAVPACAPFIPHPSPFSLPFPPPASRRSRTEPRRRSNSPVRDSAVSPVGSKRRR